MTNAEVKDRANEITTRLNESGINVRVSHNQSQFGASSYVSFYDEDYVNYTIRVSDHYANMDNRLNTWWINDVDNAVKFLAEKYNKVFKN